MTTTEDRKKYARDYARQWRLDNPEKAQNNELKRRHGITLEDYNEVLAEQGGGCAICGTPPGQVGTGDKSVGTLAVDHCHEVGAFRGLLCTNCNLGLGSFRDRVDLLKNAIAYIEAHQALVVRILARKTQLAVMQAGLVETCLAELAGP